MPRISCFSTNISHFGYKILLYVEFFYKNGFCRVCFNKSNDQVFFISSISTQCKAENNFISFLSRWLYASCSSHILVQLNRDPDSCLFTTFKHNAFCSLDSFHFIIIQSVSSNQIIIHIVILKIIVIYIIVFS